MDVSDTRAGDLASARCGSLPVRPESPPHSVNCPFLPGGQQPHLQPHPFDHPVLRPPDIWPAAAEEHAAAAPGQGHLRMAPEGAQ